MALRENSRGIAFEELQAYCMEGESLTSHYLHFHGLLIFYHPSLLCCNVMNIILEEVITNIFSDTPFLGVSHHSYLMVQNVT